MDEAEKYQQRLQAIAEKRRLQEEQERAKREMEDERLRLQQLKRKSLRDQWLMEGPPLSPTSPDAHSPRSPLWGSPAQEIEERIDKLQTESQRLAEEEEKLKEQMEDGQAEAVKVAGAAAEAVQESVVVQNGKEEASVSGAVEDALNGLGHATAVLTNIRGEGEGESSHHASEENVAPSTNGTIELPIGAVTMTFLGYSETNPSQDLNIGDKVEEEGTLLMRAERVIITDDGDSGPSDLIPQGEVRELEVTPEAEEVKITTEAEVEATPEAGVEEAEVTPEAKVGEVEVPPEAEVGEVEVTPEAEVGEVEVTPEAEFGEVEVTPEAEVGEVEVTPEAEVGEVDVTPEAEFGEVEVTPEAEFEEVEVTQQEEVENLGDTSQGEVGEVYYASQVGSEAPKEVGESAAEEAKAETVPETSTELEQEKRSDEVETGDMAAVGDGKTNEDREEEMKAAEDKETSELSPVEQQQQSLDDAVDGSTVASVPVYSEAQASPLSPRLEAGGEVKSAFEDPARGQVDEAALEAQVPGALLGQFQDVSLTDPVENHEAQRTEEGPEEAEPLLSQSKASQIQTEPVAASIPSATTDAQSLSRAAQGREAGAPKHKTCQCCSIM